MMHLLPDPAAFLDQYGYVALFLGTLLEGETVVLLAGFLAHQGYMHAPYVALAAFCGSVCSDQALFYLGRYKGDWLLRHFPRLREGVETVAAKVRGREIPLILSFRFLYGLRNVTPIFLGVSKTHPWLFTPLNILSAAIWAAAFTAGGYFFGQALRSMFGRLHAYEPYIFTGMVLTGFAVWLFRRRRSQKKNTSGR